MQIRGLPIIAGMALALAGCADISPPDWFAPGTAPIQRTRAQRFDPYPNPQTGRDDGSARPRDYLNPPPEADRGARSIKPGMPVDNRWRDTEP